MSFGIKTCLYDLSLKEIGIELSTDCSGIWLDGNQMPSVQYSFVEKWKCQMIMTLDQPAHVREAFVYIFLLYYFSLAFPLLV